MYIEGALTSKSRNIALMFLKGTSESVTYCYVGYICKLVTLRRDKKIILTEVGSGMIILKVN